MRRASNNGRGNGIVKFLTSRFSGPRMTKLKNIWPDNDPTKREQFVGENHVPLVLPNKKVGFANYMGPNTQALRRIKKGDPPRTISDKISKAHDIRYALAKNPADAVSADKKMISKLKDIKSKGLDSSINVNVALRGIQAKRFGERIGVLKRGSFARFSQPNPSETALLEGKLEQLEQEGFGIPGQELKQKLIHSFGRKIDVDRMLRLLMNKVVPMIVRRKTGKGKRIVSKRFKKRLRRRLSRRKRELKGEGIGAILAGLALSGATTLIPEIIKFVVKKFKEPGPKVSGRFKDIKGKGRKRDVKILKKMIESVFHDKGVLKNKGLMNKYIDEMFI